MRIFIAVFPPRAVQDVAAGVIEALKRERDGVSWVRRENLHYTLSFLGELGEDGALRAGEAALEAGAAHAPFDAALEQPGAFPNAGKARVLWLGMREGAEPLRALARTLERALGARGFDRADRPFAPHLTIGRVRTPADWTARLAAAPGIEARFRVEELRVIASTLSPGGSRYDVRVRAPLAAA
jgi:2'-5' RNA ligase